MARARVVSDEICGLKADGAGCAGAGHDIKVGRFPFIGNGKAIALGEAEGMIKTVFDAKTGELLGAHMVGAEVTELIQGYVVGRQLETTSSVFGSNHKCQLKMARKRAARQGIFDAN